MRITHRFEAQEMQEGVNLSAGIHFRYVNILRYEGERKAFLTRITIPMRRPGEYSCYEETWVKVRDTGMGDWEREE